MKAQHLQRSKKNITIKAKKNKIRQHSLQYMTDKISNEVNFCGKSAMVAENDMTATELMNWLID